MYDFSDVEPQQSSDLIPDGTFAKVAMTIRPGGVDGQTEIDQGLLKTSNTPGSDVLSLDCEFTVTEGRLARRKFWHSFTVSGGKVDEKGASIGWNISKRTFRAMIDSALGLDPDDHSEDAKAKRRLRGLADLDGITFVAKIAVEPNNDSRYPDQNKLDRPVLPNEKEWRAVMNGEDVPPSPSRPRSAKSAAVNTAGSREARLGTAACEDRAACRRRGMAASCRRAGPGRRSGGEARGSRMAEPVMRLRNGSGETSRAASPDSAPRRPVVAPSGAGS